MTPPHWKRDYSQLAEECRRLVAVLQAKHLNPSGFSHLSRAERRDLVTALAATMEALR